MALREALLGLLAWGPGSGYDLMKRFKESLAEVWPASQSQVYTELGKMHVDGLLSVTDSGPRGRKEYTITKAGLTELRRWLRGRPDAPKRSDMLLHVFFLDQLPPAEAWAYVRSVAEIAQQDQDKLEAVRGRIQGSSPMAVNGRYALDYGLRLAHMQREWAAWMLTQLPPAAG